MNINEIRNTFEQSMIDAEYKTFTSNFNNALRGFQKKFTNKNGIKYFITCWHYNFKEQFPHREIPEGDSYNFDVQFRKDELNWTMDITLSATFTENKWNNYITKLKEVEDFYENLFKVLKVDYYD